MTTIAIMVGTYVILTLGHALLLGQPLRLPLNEQSWTTLLAVVLGALVGSLIRDGRK